MDGLATVEIDWGGGPLQVHFTLSTPKPETPADVAIRQVTHLGADITDQLQAHQIETLRQELYDRWNFNAGVNPRREAASD